MSSTARAERRRREREAQASAAHARTNPATVARDSKGHEWMAFIPYALSPQQAHLMMHGGVLTPTEAEAPDTELFAGQEPPSDDPRVFLRASMVRRDLATVGCYRCEARYADRVAAEPCPGNPDGYRADGEPYWHHPTTGV